MGLLDVLGDIAVHSQGGEKEQAKAALESLMGRPAVRRRDRFLHPRSAPRKAEAQEAIQQWLDKQSLEKKLSAMSKSNPVASPASGGLFSTIISTINSALGAEAEKVRQDLRDYCQRLEGARGLARRALLLLWSPAALS